MVNSGNGKTILYSYNRTIRELHDNCIRLYSE